MHRLTTRLLVIGALLVWGAPLASAQTARDTAHAKTAAVATDSLTRTVQPALTRYCATKNPASYVRTVCPIFVRQVLRIRAADSALVAAAVQPPPKDSVVVVVTPPPVIPPPVVVPPVDTNTSATPTRAELPRSIPTPVFAKALRIVRVTAGTISGDLQAALNASLPGDSLILSGTFAGNFTLPTRACGLGIQIVGSAPIPPPGTRVDTVTAKAFPKIVTPNSRARCRPRSRRAAGASSASRSRRRRGRVPNVSLNYGILWFGDGGWTGGGETQVSLAQVPQQLVLDRVWIHGDATTNSTRCLKLDSGNTVVRDSWLSDCHALGSDSQAILGCNGPGPFLIENNYLEGAGENVMFGGCDPATPELIPSDITVRRNHVRKPPGVEGRLVDQEPVRAEGRAARAHRGQRLRELVAAAQLGMAIVVKSSTETCACTWEGTKDVTMRYNVFRNAHRGLNMQAIDGSSAGTTASHTERVVVENNLFTGIGTSNGIAPSDGWLMLLTHDLKDISISQNTFVGNTPGYGLPATSPTPAARRAGSGSPDNVFAGLSYYAFGSDGGLHAAAFTALAGTSWTFAGNVVSQVDGQFVGANPAGNTYVDQVAALALTPTSR
jgi:hypothetical protein